MVEALSSWDVVGIHDYISFAKDPRVKDDDRLTSLSEGSSCSGDL
jgi:hypothetical protein